MVNPIKIYEDRQKHKADERAATKDKIAREIAWNMYKLDWVMLSKRLQEYLLEKAEIALCEREFEERINKQ